MRNTELLRGYVDLINDDDRHVAFVSFLLKYPDIFVSDEGTT